MSENTLAQEATGAADTTSENLAATKTYTQYDGPYERVIGKEIVKTL